MPHPVVFAVPDEIEMRPAPMPKSWVIEGDPQVRCARLATSPDGTSGAFVWSCTAGRFHWHYPVDEYLHIISGEVIVTDEKGASRRLGPGDMVLFPAGGSSVWHVPDHVKKLAVCKHHMPPLFGFALRVWNKLASILGGPAEEGVALDGEPTGNREPERARAM